MNCRYCHKEFSDENVYCPHCGVTAKPPTAAENRQKPDSLISRITISVMIVLVLGGLIFFRAERIKNILDFAQKNIPVAALIIISIPAAIYFVFRSYNTKH